MNKNNYILTEESLTVIIDGQVFTVSEDHPNYDKLIDCVRDADWAQAYRLVDISHGVEDWTEGSIKILNRRDVLYQGERLSEFLSNLLLEFVWAGKPWKPLARFINNLMENPSKRSIEQLYTFLEHKQLPITDDGHFLAYKAVRSNWTDKHTGKFLNTVGSVLEMPRNQVNDDPRAGCSAGFHVGSLEYVAGFGRGDDLSIICKVNPRDVVSVPFDCNCQKVRCCRYEVVGLYTGPLPDLYYQGDYSGTLDWDMEGLEEEYDDDDLSEIPVTKTGSQVWNEL